ncbi:MAG: tetratricopeptide repeat protein [Planctomycetes bacterium]|nr:tetratricopeptide repeat protein [Planctomycetota bacterium]
MSAESRRTEVVTLAKRLHQELEWIPLKAMRKDRAERYRSAAELADDIGNYLNGAPLIAGPPTTVYRLKKFVRRNSVLSGAVLAVAATLILGLAATTAMYLRTEVALDKAEVALDKEARALAQAQEATELAKQSAEDARMAAENEATARKEAQQARNQAEQAAEDARQAAEQEEDARAEAQLVTNFLRWNVLGSASKFKGREATVIDVLNSAVAKLDEGFFYYQPLTEASIRATLAWTYYDLGRYAVAAKHQKPVHPIYAEHFGENHLKTNIALNMIAVYYYHAGRYREAEPLYRQIIDKAYQHETGPLVEKRLNWNANLATTCAGLGRYEEAEQLLLPNVEDRLWVGYGLHLGEIYREQGKYDDAERILLDSLDAGRKEKEESKNVQHYGGMVRCMHELALLRMAQGRYEEAEELFEQGTDFGTRELPGKDHPYTLRHVNGLAIIRIKQQRYEEAKTLLERSLEGRKLKLGENHPNTIRTIHYLGILYRELGQYDKAENLLIEAHNKRQTTLGEDHPHTLISMHELAVLYEEQELYDKAAPLLREVLEGRRLKLGDTHPKTMESQNTLIELYEAWNKPEEAEKWRARLPQTKTAEQ